MPGKELRDIKAEYSSEWEHQGCWVMDAASQDYAGADRNLQQDKLTLLHCGLLLSTLYGKQERQPTWEIG